MNLIRGLSIKYWVLIILVILVIIFIILKLTLSSGINSESFTSKKIIENYSGMDEITDISQLKPAKNEVIFVKFYAPWCGHCTRLKPTWSDLTDKFNQKSINSKKIKVVKVNCDDYPKIAENYDVSGYPTIKLLTSSGDKEYDDERNFEAMENFLKKGCN